jgi:hypothetical protein
MPDGAPARPPESALVTMPSLRSLVDQYLLRDRAELLADLERGDRVQVTIRPQA